MRIGRVAGAARACAPAFPSFSAKAAESRLRSRREICAPRRVSRTGIIAIPSTGLLAATAETLAVPLVTRDTVFAGRRSLAVIW